MIPFVDLKAQYKSLKNEILPAVERVFENAQFALGPEVAAFEEEFAAYCGTKYAVAVNSGTSALHLALLASGAGPGDEVVTVPNTFVATVAAIIYAGARPVFVDVLPDTLNMDPDRLEAAITPRTKAILPVHLYGQPADMDSISDVAEKHGLTVIEDACQAHGAAYKGRRAGSLGRLGCFSFYPGKNLGAYGEGGAVTVSDPELARTIRMYRDWGAQVKYQHVLKGYNYRMDGVQGAILRVKLRHLEDWTNARLERAAVYDAFLDARGIQRAATRPDVRHVRHIYAARFSRRDAVQERLTKLGVQTGIHYPIPVHLQEAYADLGYGPGDFPIAERAALEELSLPMFAELTREQAEEVCFAVERAANQE